MSHILTIDASVLIGACSPHEDESMACRKILEEIRRQSIPLIEPTLMPVEVSAALRRTRGDATLARDYALSLMKLPNLTLVPLDRPMTTQTIDAAASYVLRGADAVYIATAARYGAVLVTLDAEQLSRAPARLHACKPAEALELLQAE